MCKNVQEYLSAVINEFQTGVAQEHSYRPALKKLIESVGASKNIIAINEPKHIECGAPDFVIKCGEIPQGYIEAKDIGINRLDNLQGREYDQRERYRHALDNLIYTDYLDFIFYKSGNQVARVRIAEFDGKTIKPLPQYFKELENLILDFLQKQSITIRSSVKLAELMAGKARLVSDVIRQALNNKDVETTLTDQYQAFQKMLIHDIKVEEFADIYAQTIAYGMFAARLHDSTLDTFSRTEAATLIPKTNPFLRNLFSYIAGPNIDERIIWVVDSLADIFVHTNVTDIMKNFGRNTETRDPILHFYETFLAEYDPKQRKKRGVFYTPQPVVEYIVKSVDYILKHDFGLPKGLADKSKIVKKVEVQGTDKPVNKEFHRVQVLDPATGTGTFLAETINFIYNNNFQDETGLWTRYVDEDLLPRIHGFELLMASYAMAHLKLDLVLRSTGYVQNDVPINNQIFRQDDLFDFKRATIGKNAVVKDTNERLSVYLTNSLEEADPNTQNLFLAQWLSNEAKEANIIKKDIPVMCIIGNPPYSVSSSNNNQFARDLIEKYKTGLNERKINLDDDYIKFIALGQHYIERNGSGILAFITNNSFIDGITHRQMRHSLMETFDNIYILNLHGNSRHKETAPDGSKDENVFDIMTGVSINIFVKKTNRKAQATIHFADLFGRRNNKYAFLTENSIETTMFRKLNPVAPNYFFVEKDFQNKAVYDNGFGITELFQVKNSGIKTDRDTLFIDIEKQKLESRIQLLLSGKYDDVFANKFNVHDSGSYKITKVIMNTKYFDQFISPICYRPFDLQCIYYDKNIISRPANKVMQHMLNDNIALLTSRNIPANQIFNHVWIVNGLSDIHTCGGQSYHFPLYTYYGGKKESNLDQRIVRQIDEAIGRNAESLEIFDYIYGVLHSPSYRNKYREFLRIDFPWIPYPKNDAEFIKYAHIGTKLRTLHLMESVPVSDVKYYVSGSDIIDKPRYETGRVYINNTQYFDNVPEIAWIFFIGGYQPAQKWLKDRKGRKLSVDEILHYKNIISVLTETEKIINEIEIPGNIT